MKPTVKHFTPLVIASLLVGLMVFLSGNLPQNIKAETYQTYYLSPTGNDANSGLSEAEAWASFSRAWQALQPGDTLLLMDGVYTQTLAPNVRNGQEGLPITVKALNDGKAIIDGQGQRTPVKLGRYNNDPLGSYFVLEGIVAKNGGRTASNNDEGHVYQIYGHHNVLRRVSGYNAWTDGNSQVFTLGTYSHNNTIEDCAASGTGRKMIMAYRSNNNIIRRCFTNWQQWDGRESCQIWPWGENIDLYNSNNNIVENSIGYGKVPLYGVTVRSNNSSQTADNNQILGTINVNAGMENGVAVDWPSSRPQPTSCTQMRKWTQYGYRSGFQVYNYGGAVLQNNVWRDILSYGNAGHGFARTKGPSGINLLVERATIWNNGLDNGYGGNTSDGPVGRDIDFAKVNDMTLNDSYIEGTAYAGAGARLETRYVNGVLTDEPLWPWPMEDRIVAEMGISVTQTIYEGVVKQAPTYVPSVTPTPTMEVTPTIEPSPTETPLPTPTLEPTATPIPQPSATPDPTPEPTVEPTPEPSPTSAPEPTPTEVPVTANVLVNESFELDSDGDLLPDSWLRQNASTTDTMILSTAGLGNYVYRITPSSKSNKYKGVVQNYYTNGLNGDVWDIRLWTMQGNPASAGYVRVKLNIYNASAQLLGSYYQNLSKSAGSYQTVSFTLPSDYARVKIMLESSLTASDAYFDDVSMVKR